MLFSSAFLRSAASLAIRSASRLRASSAVTSLRGLGLSPALISLSVLLPEAPSISATEKTPLPKSGLVGAPPSAPPALGVGPPEPPPTPPPLGVGPPLVPPPGVGPPEPPPGAPSKRPLGADF